MAPNWNRTSRERRERTTILIIGEGEKTEPNYFDGLKREEPIRRAFTITVKKGPGYNPEAVVREAINQRKGAAQRGQEYDEVWCILDVEGPEKRESLDAAVRLAKENGIGLCLSNPAFEVWVLAHFVRTSRSFKDCNDVIQELNKHWEAVSKEDYDKGDESIYRRIASRTGTALTNAQEVREKDHKGFPNTADANSSTEMYSLVKRLLG